MGFRTYLVVRELDEKSWELQRDLVYEGNYDHFLVPSGFETDFASVPRMFWWLLPRHGRWTKAAVLHDFLWREAKKGNISFCDADGIFRRVMRELGVGYLRRRLMWAAVRWAGGALKCGWKQLLLVVLIMLLALPLLVPAVVVSVFLVVFWLVALIVYWIRRALGWEPTGPPRLLLR